MLRQHKRRVIQYIEETLPDDVLDLGTTVLVMQVSCRAPGCVPLETIITIVFPTTEAVLTGLNLTKNNTTFQTKILMPMSDVTKDDVLEALPPAFQGGKQTVERQGLRARDVMLAQITQLFNDQPSKNMMAQYLKQSLQDYIDRDCEPPEYGEAFPELQLPSKDTVAAAAAAAAAAADTTSTTTTRSNNVQDIQTKTGNLVIRRVLDDDDNGKKEDGK